MPLEGSPVPCGAVVSTIVSQHDGSLLKSPGGCAAFECPPFSLLLGYSDFLPQSEHMYFGESWTGYFKLSLLLNGPLFLRANIAPGRGSSHPHDHASQQWSEEGWIVCWWAPCSETPATASPLQLSTILLVYFSMSEATFLQVPHDDLIMFMHNSKTRVEHNNAAGAELTLTFCAWWGKHFQVCGETLSYAVIFSIPWKLLADFNCTYKLKTKQRQHTTDDVCIKWR